ncbi:cache domain-containing protein [Nocardiopsis oceani]
MTAPQPADSHPADIVTWIAEIIEDVFTPLESLRQDLVTCHRSADQQLTCKDLASIRPRVVSWLSSQDLVIGAGAIIAPGLLADQPRRLEWWSGRPDPDFLDVDLNPERLDFYDYACAEWFREPRTTGRRHITGPHVDFGGTDSYILTFTLPVYSQESFLGVVGADILAAHLESRLLPVLISLDYEVVLLNAEHRVITSNTPHRPSGTLCTTLPGTGHTLPDSPWRLLCHPAPGATSVQ